MKISLLLLFVCASYVVANDLPHVSNVKKVDAVDKNDLTPWKDAEDVGEFLDELNDDLTDLEPMQENEDLEDPHDDIQDFDSLQDDDEPEEDLEDTDPSDESEDLRDEDEPEDDLNESDSVQENENAPDLQEPEDESDNVGSPLVHYYRKLAHYRRQLNHLRRHRRSEMVRHLRTVRKLRRHLNFYRNLSRQRLNRIRYFRRLRRLRRQRLILRLRQLIRNWKIISRRRWQLLNRLRRRHARIYRRRVRVACAAFCRRYKWGSTYHYHPRSCYFGLAGRQRNACVACRRRRCATSVVYV